MKIGGIIYLLSIVDAKMKGTTRRNLDMFFQLCGNKVLPKVILGTTKWEEVFENVGEDRERQLEKFFWKTMTTSKSGSNLELKMLRFDKTNECAWVFLDVILGKFGGNEDALRIQKEIVDLDRTIPETEAGKKMLYTLEQVLKMQREAGSEKEAEHSASLEEQINELRIPLSRRLYLMIFVSRL